MRDLFLGFQAELSGLMEIHVPWFLPQFLLGVIF